MMVKLVTMPRGGRLDVPVWDKADNAFAQIEALGFKRNGIKLDNTGPVKLAPILVGQPTFEGLCGPMYEKDGEGNDAVRYETWEAYNFLSK